MRVRVVRLCLACTAALFVLVPAGASAGPPAEVSIEFSDYRPSVLDVLPGGTMSWTNVSVHLVTSDTGLFDSGEVAREAIRLPVRHIGTYPTTASSTRASPGGRRPTRHPRPVATAVVPAARRSSSTAALADTTTRSAPASTGGRRLHHRRHRDSGGGRHLEDQAAARSRRTTAPVRDGHQPDASPPVLLAACRRPPTRNGVHVRSRPALRTPGSWSRPSAASVSAGIGGERSRRPMSPRPTPDQRPRAGPDRAGRQGRLDARPRKVVVVPGRR